MLSNVNFRYWFVIIGFMVGSNFVYVVNVISYCIKEVNIFFKRWNFIDCEINRLNFIGIWFY